MIKRLQTFDKITTYPHGTSAFKVYESEMMTVTKCIYINKKLDKSYNDK